MLTHTFFCCNFNELPKNKESIINDFFRLKIQKDIVSINDDIVLKYSSLFSKGFKTLDYSLNNLREGINYYGISVISPNEILNFKNIIDSIQEKEIIGLIKLCCYAIEEKEYLVHFGV